MKRLTYSFETTVMFSEPVENHSFVLRCMPASAGGQRADAHLSLAPDAPVSLQCDSFGNVLAVGSLARPHTSFTYRSYGRVEVDGAAAPAEKAHPMFRFASPLVRMSPAMVSFAQGAGLEQGAAVQLAPEVQRGQVERLMCVLHGALAYEPGSTTVATTASAAFEQGRGVCQDFAHIMVAILRWWGVPARYASGLTVGEGATHAWAQAHIGGRWLGFDPTRNQACDDDYIVLAVGRDWADCPIERGTFTGTASQTQTVFMEVAEQ